MNELYSPVLKALPWLPVHHWIGFKVWLTAYKLQTLFNHNAFNQSSLPYQNSTRSSDHLSWVPLTIKKFLGGQALSAWISRLVSVCTHHLSINQKCRCTLEQAFVICIIDFCHSVAYGLPATTIQPVTTVLHCAAMLIRHFTTSDHVTPTLVNYTGFPNKLAKNFKICLLLYCTGCPQIHLLMFPHFSHLVHLSNPYEVYDLRLKLILLSHDHLENLKAALHWMTLPR